jgi:WD40 repeat protein
VFSPDSKVLAAVEMTVGIGFFDAESGKRLARQCKDSLEIQALRFSPDGNWLVSSHREDAKWPVKIWDAGTGKQLHVLHGHKKLVDDIALSSDGGMMATAGVDGEIRIWKMPKR